MKINGRPVSILAVIAAFFWLVASQVHIGSDARTVADRARAAARAAQDKAAELKATADQAQRNVNGLLGEVRALQGKVSAGVATPADVDRLKGLLSQAAAKPGPSGPPGPAGGTGPPGPAGVAPATTTTTTSTVPATTTSTTRSPTTTTSTRPPPTTTTTRRGCVNLGEVVKIGC